MTTGSAIYLAQTTWRAAKYTIILQIAITYLCISLIKHLKYLLVEVANKTSHHPQGHNIFG